MDLHFVETGEKWKREPGVDIYSEFLWLCLVPGHSDIAEKEEDDEIAIRNSLIILFAISLGTYTDVSNKARIAAIGYEI